MRRRQRVMATALSALALAGGIWAGGIAPAQAAARDGNCESGEFCYFYDTGLSGSASDFTVSVKNYGTTQPSCYEFRGPGNGKGLCIKNRASSAWNRSGQTVRVYFNSNHQGVYQDIAPGVRTDLNATLRKENASHAFLGTPPPPPPPPPATTSFGPRVLAAGTFDLYVCRVVASNGVGVKYAVRNNGPFYINRVEILDSLGNGVYLDGIGVGITQQNSWGQLVYDGTKFVTWSYQDYYGATNTGSVGSFDLDRSVLPLC